MTRCSMPELDTGNLKHKRMRTVIAPRHEWEVPSTITLQKSQSRSYIDFEPDWRTFPNPNFSARITLETAPVIKPYVYNRTMSIY